MVLNRVTSNTVANKPGTLPAEKEYLPAQADEEEIRKKAKSNFQNNAEKITTEGFKKAFQWISTRVELWTREQRVMTQASESGRIRKYCEQVMNVKSAELTVRGRDRQSEAYPIGGSSPGKGIRETLR